MKRVDLVKHLRSHGCRLLRTTGRHPIWINPDTGRTAPVPDHREVDTSTARDACKQLGVPPPPFR